MNDLVTFTLTFALKIAFLDFVAAGGILSVSQTHLEFFFCFEFLGAPMNQYKWNIENNNIDQNGGVIKRQFKYVHTSSKSSRSINTLYVSTKAKNK